MKQKEKTSKLLPTLEFGLIFLSISIIFYFIPQVINFFGREFILTKFTLFEILIYALIFSIIFSVHRQVTKGNEVLVGIGAWFATVFEQIYEKLSIFSFAKKKKTKETKKTEKAMKKTESKKPKKKINIKNRIIFVVILAFFSTGAILYPPIMPHVQLPAEQLTATFFTFLGQDFGLTNTLIATFLTYAFLLIMGYGIYKQYKKGTRLIAGVPGFFVMIYEMLYDISINSVGKKHAKKIFPLFCTIFAVIMIANLMELIPGVDSIGLLHPSEHGYPVQQVTENVFLMVQEDASASAHDSHAQLYGVYPFLRAAATDLNFTLAIAVVAMASVQVYGVMQLGKGYFKKFWNIDGLIKMWKQPKFGGPLNMIKAFIDWIVGLLEIMSESAKIISFTFRLFGVIFAGQVLLFVVGSIVPVIPFVVQGPFYLLELFFGLLQAFVFGMLTMVFMKIASTSHAHEEVHED